MSEYSLQLYTSRNLSTVNEAVNFSLYVYSTATGLNTIDSYTPSFTANFSDYSVTSYICTYQDHKFAYEYKTPLNPAYISISADIQGEFIIGDFDILQVTLEPVTTDLQVPRVSTLSVLELPNQLVYIPVNEFATSEAVNRVLDRLYDNFEYLINACKAFKPAPTKFIGWGSFDSFLPKICYEKNISNNNHTFNNVYGVLNEPTGVLNKKIIKLQDIPRDLYESGTSTLLFLSAIKTPSNLQQTSDSIYFSNLLNKGIQTLSAENLSTISAEASGYATFTQSIIDYKISNEEQIQEPILDGYLVIDTCNSRKLVELYTFNDAIIPSRETYKPKTINWRLKDQFNYTGLVSSAPLFNNINDLFINQNILYTARDSFVEIYNISDALNEITHTTETIDISEIFTKAQSVVTTSNGTIFLLDIVRLSVSMYKISDVTGKLVLLNRWGSLGGPEVKNGFYKPTGMFIKNDEIYICDSGNKVIKKYTSQGYWLKTYADILPADSQEQIINGCVDINQDIHILTTNFIIKINAQGQILKQTSLQSIFDTDIKYVTSTTLDVQSPTSTPVKVVANSDGGLLYICFQDFIYRLSLNHEPTNKFAVVGEQLPGVGKYVSITTDQHYNLYLTDGQVLVKYLDIPETLEIRRKITDDLFWTRNQIYIKPNEFVSEWVYNKTFRRLAENLEILFKTIEYKLIPDNSTLDELSFKLALFNDKDKGYYDGLPVKLKDFCSIGVNEFVTPEVINRCIEMLQENTYYILYVIYNLFTAEKSGLEANFFIAPPVLPSCCWDWQNRVQGNCCAPWYLLTKYCTWNSARSKNNAIILNNTRFTIPKENAIKFNKISPEISFSFWISSGFNSENYYNLIGLDTVDANNTGVSIQVSGTELVANINGSYFPTSGSIMSTATASYQDSINGLIGYWSFDNQNLNNSYGNLLPISLQGYNTNNFHFKSDGRFQTTCLQIPKDDPGSYYLKISKDNELTYNQNITVNLHINLPVIQQAEQYILAHKQNAYKMFLKTVSPEIFNVIVEAYDNSDSTYNYALIKESVDVNLLPETWHTIGFTYTNNTDVQNPLKLYINGEDYPVKQQDDVFQYDKSNNLVDSYKSFANSPIQNLTAFNLNTQDIKLAINTANTTYRVDDLSLWSVNLNSSQMLSLHLLPSTELIPPIKITHITFSKVYKNNNSTCMFYVNNALNTMYDQNVPIEIARNSVTEDNIESDFSSFSIGSISGSTNFQGILHDVWVFNKALTPQENQVLYDKFKFWELPNDLRVAARGHWYGNSPGTAWEDDVRNHVAIREIGPNGSIINLDNVFGPCCDIDLDKIVSEDSNNPNVNPQDFNTIT